jgi:hypothetical protein
MVEPGMTETAILFQQPLSLSMIGGLTIALGSSVVLMRLPTKHSAFLTTWERVCVTEQALRDTEKNLQAKLR